MATLNDPGLSEDELGKKLVEQSTPGQRVDGPSAPAADEKVDSHGFAANQNEAGDTPAEGADNADQTGGGSGSSSGTSSDQAGAAAGGAAAGGGHSRQLAGAASKAVKSDRFKAMMRMMGSTKVKILGVAGGILLLVIILIIFFFLSIFKMNTVEKLFLTRQFSRFHNAMRSRALEQMKLAKAAGAKGTVNTKWDEKKPLSDQLKDFNKTELDTAIKDPAEMNHRITKMKLFEWSKGGTGRLIGAEFRFDRKTDKIKDDEKRKGSDVEKEVKQAERKSVQLGEIKDVPGGLKDAKEQINQDLDKGMSPEAALSDPAVYKKVKLYGWGAKFDIGTMLITFYCMGREIWEDTLGKLAHEQAKGLVRLAAKTFADADGEKLGKLGLQQAGGLNALWDNGKESFIQSAAYKTASGHPVGDSTKTATTALPFENAGVHLYDWINRLFPKSGPAALVIDPVCSFVLNPVGQIIAAGVSIVIQVLAALATGGGSAVTVAAVATAAKDVIKETVLTKAFVKSQLAFFAGTQAISYLGAQMAIHMMNAQTTGTEDPIQRANKVNAGSDIMAQETYRFNGGRRLTAKEVAEMDAQQKAEEVAEAKSRGIIWNVFSPDNPKSVVTQFAMQLPSNPKAASRQVNEVFAALAPSNMVNSFMGVMSGMVTPAYAAAQDPTNGTGDPDKIPQYGITEAEFKANPIIPNSKYVEANLSAIQGKYGKCFNFKEHDFVDDQKKENDYCNKDNGVHSDLTRYRVWLFDKGIAKNQILNYNNQDTEPHTGILVFSGGGGGAGAGGAAAGAATSAAGAATPSNLFGSSVGTPCAAGTTDAGVADGYHGGQLVKIRLCTIPNLPSSGSEDGGHAKVNSIVSDNVFKMVSAAKAAGVNLSANSSFRSMAHQQQLYAHPQAPTAKPGYSNHQMGEAIDFANCSHGSASFQWLANNASKFGYKNLPSESWHWSTTGG